ncbi:unnamed protein product, partial [Adineta steineri]
SAVDCFFPVDLFDTNILTDGDYHPEHLVCEIVDHRKLLSFVDLYFHSIISSILIIIFNILIIIAMFYTIIKRHDSL